MIGRGGAGPARRAGRQRASAAVLSLVVVLAAGVATRAAAQDGPRETAAPTPVVGAARAPRIEFTVLGGVIGGADLGDTRADVLTNQVPTSGTTALFSTSTSLGAATTVEGRVGVRLTRAWVVEAGLSYGRPELRVDISGDVEAAGPVTAVSSLSQYIVDGALQYRWPGRRVTPFVMGGGGYLRQLDEPRTTADTGAVFYGGGGVRVALAPGSRGLLGSLALRGDARLVWLRKGVTLNEERGPTFSVSGGVSAGW